MQQGAIGVFDSGVGGLTVVRALRALLPHETILYLGDTARVPYGTRSGDTVRRYSLEALRFLEVASRELDLRKRQASQPPEQSPPLPLKMVIIACNTATAYALSALRERCSIPVIGVIRSAVWKAMQLSKSRRVGIIGTAGTVRSGAYQSSIRSADPSAVVLAKACPLLVPLVEEGWLDHPVTDLTLATYLAEYKESSIDTLILGCTHYPLLRGAVDRYFGQSVALVDPSESVSQEATLLLQKRGWLASEGQEGELICFVTDTPHRFQQVAHRFLGGAPQRVEQVDLSQYVRGIGAQEANDHRI
ncbi:MAG: glutamate racemase [Deltaproteobacteria bacterium]|nr:MAG: glutamate racemase [Deltaproteobacteria bacterium]